MTKIVNDLEWQIEPIQQMSLNDANEYVSSLGDEWRLPTIEELKLLSSDYSDFFIDKEWIWLNESAVGHSNVWNAHFNPNGANKADTTNTYLVLCVRNVQNNQ